MTHDRPHACKDYEIFLQGIEACQLKQPRRAPPALDATGPDSDAALWLAGYDAERDEQRLMRRYGLNEETAH